VSAFFTTYVVIARVTEYDTWSQTLRRDASVNYWLVSTLTLPYHFGAFLLTSITLLAAAFLLSRRFDLNEFFNAPLLQESTGAVLSRSRARRQRSETARTPDEFTGFDPKDEIPPHRGQQTAIPNHQYVLEPRSRKAAWPGRNAGPRHSFFRRSTADSTQPEPSTNKRSLLANIEIRPETGQTRVYRPTSQYGGGIQLGNCNGHLRRRRESQHGSDYFISHGIPHDDLQRAARMVAGKSST
jgi:hypothetical protein